MGKIYKNQTALRITAFTGVDITGATTLLLKYKKPDASTGQFTATIDGNRSLYYQITSSADLDQSGIWIFWAHVTFADGTIAAGEAFNLTVSEEGL